jgi:hypothetical protein
MPLPVPVLDDRDFEQLVAESRALIPRYSTPWTNHNVSDPGITLLELFAYLADTSIFELDQVPGDLVARWLRLLGDCPAPGTPVAAATADAFRSLRTVERAITADDVADIAMRESQRLARPIARAEYLPSDDPVCHWPQPVGVLVVVPAEASLREDAATLLSLSEALHRALAPATLITTRLHVMGPEWVDVGMKIAVARRPASGLSAEAVRDAVAGFLDPLVGGEDGSGWPFGRPVYRSELFQLLEQLPAVDHVESIELVGENLTRRTQLPRVGHEAVDVEVGEVSA